MARCLRDGYHLMTMESLMHEEYGYYVDGFWTQVIRSLANEVFVIIGWDPLIEDACCFCITE
jgi:hypothetical protein